MKLRKETKQTRKWKTHSSLTNRQGQLEGIISETEEDRVNKLVHSGSSKSEKKLVRNIVNDNWEHD